MLPSAYPYDQEQLKALWKTFVQQGILPSELQDLAVARSWCCCRDAGLDPRCTVQPLCCSEEMLEQRRQACFDLIAIARPFMEDVYQFAGETDMIVYLADEELYILEWLGDEVLGEQLEEMGLRDGVQLAEEQIGTNAAALALGEGRPMQIVGPEHYCQAYHALTDTAAPVHAPAGQMMGVIGVVALEENSHPHTLGIVMAAARAIENQLQAELSLSEAHQHLAELNASLQAMGKGIIFLSPEGKVTHINTSAGDVLGVPYRSMMGRQLGRLVELPAEVQSVMTQRASMKEKEVLLRVDGESCPCLMSVDVLREGSRLLGFILTLEHAADVRRLVHRMVGAQAHFTFDDIVGEDVKMQRILYYARAIARSESPVLLLGESGTGKEFFAQAIHNASRNAEGPFIAVDCAAVPSELMAGDLFGYAETAIGVEEGRPGKFELAEGGTIFFDNVDSMSPNIQASLLRVIDTKELVRLGGNRVISLDVRIIAASSNMDLADEVKQGRFRSDLFYRLHALTLTIPALRDRGNDILLLIAHLTEKLGRRLGKNVTVSSEAIAVLQSYHWPGNVRELENVLEWAIHMMEGSELTLDHLPQELRRATLGGMDETILSLEEAERQAIIRAGRALQGQTTKMAEALGIGRTTLWRKMKAFDLSPDSFK